MHGRSWKRYVSVVLVGVFVASTGAPAVGAQEVLARTFATEVASAAFHWEHGAGWFDPGGDTCVIRLHGLEAESGFYYGGLRTTYNVPTEDPAPLVGSDALVPDPTHCAGGVEGAALGTSDPHVGVGSWFGQRLLFEDAYGYPLRPEAESVVWKVIVCPVDEVLFTPGDIADVPGLAALALGSSSIACSDAHDPIDLSPFLTKIDQDGIRTGVLRPSVESVVPRGSGDSVVVSCVRLDARGFDVDGRFVTFEGLTAHDWFMVLDIGSPSTWSASMSAWLDGSARGLYDLSGNNGCPFGIEDI